MFCQIFDSMLNPVFDLENKAKVKGNPNNMLMSKWILSCFGITLKKERKGKVLAEIYLGNTEPDISTVFMKKLLWSIILVLVQCKLVCL